MLRTALAAALAVCLCTPSARAETPGSAPCPTLETSHTEAQAFAESRSYGYVSVDGAAARTMLDLINEIEPKSDFHSDHIGLLLSVSDQRGLVFIADGECGGYRTFIALPLGVIMTAYAKVRGQGI